MNTSEIIYWVISGSMVACFVLTLIFAAFDERTIDGVNSVWAKPLKFETSLAIHAATLALVMSALNTSVRAGSLMLILSMMFLAACIIEMGYIIFQAARAEHSHFNTSTPFAHLMWSVMAFAAIVIVGTAGAIGMTMIFSAENSLTPALRWAIVIGLIGGTLLTLYTAFTIGANNSPYVGAVSHDKHSRMIITGWSLVVGDLRVSHFLATHMIQILPFAGLLISQLAPGRVGITIVVIVAIFWSVLTVFEYRRAMAGVSSHLAISIGSQ